jgi:uncharacterized protein YbjT (DUF2867 family)
MTTDDHRILVTGATGNVGRQVVSTLVAAGATVRALVRVPDMADRPDSVELVRGDLTDPASLTPALAGTGSVFLLWPFFSADDAPPVLDVIARHAHRVRSPARKRSPRPTRYVSLAKRSAAWCAGSS